MIIESAVFVKSAADMKGCPDEKKAEYAFIGRSNVGKSSLINFLTGAKGLAKTSSTPGKTRLINYFLINDCWFIVDLPGLGYAKISKKVREEFEKKIKSYLSRRKQLLCTFLLIDVRHAPLPTDLELMQWMAENELPFVIVFTKTDKLSKTELHKNITKYKQELLKSWESLPAFFYTSTLQKTGREEILGFIEETNKLLV